MAEEVVLKVALHPGQLAIYNSPARFKVCAAGRRFGKSFFAGNMLMQEAMRTENAAGYELTARHGIYYVAPTFDQAKRIMWPLLHELLGFERNGGLIRNENVNDGWIELVNQRRIYIRGADNPDSLRGIALSYVVLDEYADMKSNVWHEIIEPALMDVEGSALFIGTPKGKNHFYKLFMGALTKPTIDDYGNEVDWSDWDAFHFKSTDNPFLSVKELRRMRGGNRPLEVVRQEIDASFLSGGGKILKPEWFKVVTNQPDVSDGHVFVTVDFAGFKKVEGNKMARTDETVVVETLVVEDRWYILNIKHGRWDVRETAQNIVLACRKYYAARLGMESGALANAVQWALEDYMREFNRYVTPEPLRHGNTNKHSRIQWALQGRAERGMIYLVKGDWNEAFLTQAADFPDPLAHDDILDAVAYVDQLSTATYAADQDVQEWEAQDLDSGY